MAHILANSHPRFNSYPTMINTQYTPAPKQYSSYHYAPATPANTPTKSHPSSSYPYRQALNPSHSQLASAPVAQQAFLPLDLLGASSHPPLDQSPARGPQGLPALAKQQEIPMCAQVVLKHTVITNQ
ncbi:hypothetical protein FRC06_009067 [Ceratobasidium sp. 370]|nr:hypothetical protein FRC06_009067 [Ceratobasidium sp. 370]